MGGEVKTLPAAPEARSITPWLRPVEVFLLALTLILAGTTGLVGWRRRA